MAIQQMVNINPEALKREIQKRGLNHVDMSVEMGRGRNYLTDSFRRMKFHTTTTVMLKQMYNISPEAYVVEEAKPEEKAEKAPEPELEVLFKRLIENTTLAENLMYKVVYQAVYKGVSKALKDAGIGKGK